VLKNVFIWNNVINILESGLATAICASIGLHSAGRQKERIAANPEKDRYGGSRKMWRNVE
jgi:hypothetical protein